MHHEVRVLLDGSACFHLWHCDLAARLCDLDCDLAAMWLVKACVRVSPGLTPTQLPPKPRGHLLKGEEGEGSGSFQEAQMLTCTPQTHYSRPRATY